MSWKNDPVVSGWQADPVVDDGPQTSRKPASVLGAAGAIASGVNKGATILAGLPADTVANVIDLGIAGYGTLKRAIGGQGTQMPDPLDRSKLPLTSAWIQDRARQTDAGRAVIDAGAQDYPTLHAGGTAIGAAAARNPRAAVTAFSSGVAGHTVGERTGSPEAAMLASMAPYAPAAIRTGLPRPKITGPDVRAAHADDYVVPPAQSNPTMTNKLLEGLAGKRNVQQATSLKNQEVTNSLARKALGLPEDAPLTPQTLEAVRRNAARAYEPVRSLGQMPADRQYIDDVLRLRQQAENIARSFPDLDVNGAATIQKMVNGLLVADMDSSAVVDAVRTLRKGASANLSPLAAADPARRALGQAQIGAADALEALLERQVAAAGRPDLVANLRAARTQIAKTYSVEAALNETTGNVSATKLGQQLSKGKPLSGELERIARFGRSFPKSAATVTESMPGVSPLDWGVGVGVASLTGNPEAMALPLARPTTRALLTNKLAKYLAVPADRQVMDRDVLLGASRVVPWVGSETR